MAENSVANSILKTIQKIQSKSDYYRSKAKYDTFLRDGIIYANNEEWQEYWLELSKYWDNVIEEYYKVLKIVNKEQIGILKYPIAPSNKDVY